jgi:hypothetical protein
MSLSVKKSQVQMGSSLPPTTDALTTLLRRQVMATFRRSEVRLTSRVEQFTLNGAFVMRVSGLIIMYRLKWQCVG